jgi:excisionase family DNA binding protein
VPELDRLLTVDEVADVLRVPVSTLYGWRLVGKGPRAAKVGRFLRYRASDVAAWLDDQMRSRADVAS